MLTPRFQLSQTPNHLILNIYAPFTNVSETEIFMEEFDFRFYSKPYFLRLHLPGKIEETDSASANYDAETRSFVIHAPKRTPGEHFDGLDMLTSLLTPKGAHSFNNIQVSNTNNDESLHSHNDNDDDLDGQIDWYMEQELPSSIPSFTVEDRRHKGYGFGFTDFNVFDKLLEESREILDVKTPDTLTHKERKKERIRLEMEAFDPSHYLCDLYESSEIDLSLLSSSLVEVLEKDFTQDEQERLLSLPRREFLIEDKKDMNAVYFGLLDILFAFCYDARTTENEHNSESGWTICKLCSTFVCSEKFTTLSQCLIASVRRSLIFPLFRNYKLSLKVMDDVLSVLLSGKVSILKILLRLIPILNEYDERYIFNRLYVEPYAVWIQTINPIHLSSLHNAVHHTLSKITKADLDLELVELEEAAELCYNEKEEGHVEDIIDDMKRVRIKEELDSDDNSDSSDTSDSSDSSDESDSSGTSDSSDESCSDSSSTPDSLDSSGSKRSEKV